MDMKEVAKFETPVKLKLSEAIRIGADLVKEDRTGFLHTNADGDRCGCALGTAAVAACVPYQPGDVVGLYSALQEKFGVSRGMLSAISTMHAFNQMNRAQIADWLEAQGY